MPWHKARAAIRVYLTGAVVLLPGCPSQKKTASGKINLAVGGIFRLLVICDRTRFLAGNTPEERAEPTFTTQVLILKKQITVN